MTQEDKEDYVSFEVAKLLKEKGFEQEPDYATSWYANQYYKNACQGEWFEGEHQIIEDIDDKCNVSYFSERGIFIPAPTLQMACKWLREVHNKHCDIGYDIDLEWHFQIIDLKETVEYDYPEPKFFHAKNEIGFKTYEEAVEAALKYVLENLI